MSGPWDQYQQQTDGPWAKYAAPDAAPTVPPPAAKPGFVDNLLAPAKAAWGALKTDAGRLYAADSNPQFPAHVTDVIPGLRPADQALGSVAKDAFDLVSSPISGILNAGVVQPGANLLDHLPVPLDPHTLQPMSKDQQHRVNENMIGTALMAVGPKGARLGFISPEAEAAVSAKFGTKAAKVVAQVPEEVAVTPKGDLTDEGHEAAQQAELHPEQLKAAYAEAAATPEAPRTQTVRRYNGQDYPVEVLDPTPVDHEGAPHVKVRGDDGSEGYVPAADLAEVPVTPSAAPEAAPKPADSFEPAANDTMPPSATERLTTAKAEGVDLTRGQATQDFDTQAREETLKNTGGPESAAARQFFQRQQEQIKGALDQFRAGFGDPEATAEQRGQIVKDAVRGLRDSGKAGVTALYEQARDLASKLGHNAENLIHLDTEPLLAKMREIWSDEGIPDPVRKSLKQQAARYGLIGDSPKTVEGETTVSLRDTSGEPAGKVTFTGPPQRLTVLNAEDLRKKLNALYDQHRTPEVLSLKPIVDNALQGAVERAASAEGHEDIGGAFKAARAAHMEQQQTFNASDIVQKVIDWKKGARGTDLLKPEDVMKAVLGNGPDAVSNLKRMKAVLLSKPTERSRAAWEAIRAHAIGRAFDAAVTLNANLGDGAELGTVSGAKLNTQIAKLGAPKLKVLLSDAEFNRLMRLKRVVGLATIPIKGTPNPSGSGFAVIRFLADWGGRAAKIGLHIVPGGRLAADVVGGVAKVGKEASEAKRTLHGVTEFTAEQAAKEDTPKEAFATARRFLRVAASNEFLAPIIATAANEERP
jgi:hypothetical protein